MQRNPHSNHRHRRDTAGSAARRITVPTDLTRIEDITRREFMFSALGAALLVACGDGDDEESPSPTAAPTMRTFVDATGASVEVPVRPQRIVQVGTIRRGLGPLLTLGASVVGATFYGEEEPAISDFFSLENIQEVAGAEEVDLEAVAALAPDLIVVVYRGGNLEVEPAVFDQLKEIAPTVAIDNSVSLEEYMARHVELLGSDAAETLSTHQRELESLVQQIAATLGRPEEVSVSVVRLTEDNMMNVYGGAGIRPINDILARAGITWSGISQEAEAAGGGIVGVSLERIQELEADLLVHFESMPQGTLLDTLEVVKAGQVLISENRAFLGFHYPSYIACAKDLLAQIEAMPQPIRTDIA